MKQPLSEKYMRRALREAEKNLRLNPLGGPFAACIVKGAQMLAVARSTVLVSDATAHAEISAIRQASKKLGTFDLSGCIIYSTTEPCPMCFGAIHWARLEAIAYGTTIAQARQLGFRELTVTNSRMKSLGRSAVQIYPGFLKTECRELFEKFRKLKHKSVY